MYAAYFAIALLTIVATSFVAIADFVRAGWVLANSASVGVPESWLTRLGILKAAGAIGLAVGLVGVPMVGTAAAIGLILFFIGAVVTHLRAGDFSLSLGFPVGYLLLATVTLVLGLVHHGGV